MISRPVPSQNGHGTSFFFIFSPSSDILEFLHMHLYLFYNLRLFLVHDPISPIAQYWHWMIGKICFSSFYHPNRAWNTDNCLYAFFVLTFSSVFFCTRLFHVFVSLMSALCLPSSFFIINHSPSIYQSGWTCVRNNVSRIFAICVCPVVALAISDPFPSSAGHGMMLPATTGLPTAYVLAIDWICVSVRLLLLPIGSGTFLSILRYWL